MARLVAALVLTGISVTTWQARAADMREAVLVANVRTAARLAAMEYVCGWQDYDASGSVVLRIVRSGVPEKQAIAMVAALARRIINLVPAAKLCGQEVNALRFSPNTF